MKNLTPLRLNWLLLLIEGLAVWLTLLFGMGGRPGSGWMRIVLPAFTGMVWLALVGLGDWLISSPDRERIFSQRARGWLRTGGHILALQSASFAAALLALELFIFSFMFLPPFLRGLAVWLGAAAVQTWVGLQVYFRDERRARGPLFPRFANLDLRQARLLLVLGLVGLVYFLAFLPSNLGGAEDAGRFLVSGGDEVVIYPVLTTMLTPADSLRTDLYRFIEYDDYHYGYPFYFLSALAVLPSRLIFGPGFGDQYQINLALLRQVISVLPMVLAAILLTVLGTRLRSTLRSLTLIGLILSIPAVFRNNIHFWHPDGLGVLFVVLTLFFLTRDRLRLGRNFYLAAVFCGLASATRLVGFFFVLGIAGYLAAVWLKRHSIGSVLASAAWFGVVMSLTILLSSPYLFDSGARSRMLATIGQKSGEMAFGYNEPDPEGVYKTGWDAWLPFFERDYAQAWFIGFLCLSALVALAGKERTFAALLLAWVGMIGGYLILFVASKAFQYQLPVFVPFYGAALLLLTAPEGGKIAFLQNRPYLGKWIIVLTYTICYAQLAFNLIRLFKML